MMTASHDLDDFKTEGESSANSIRYRKISAIRRTLWWLGLLLLSPAPAAFITEDGVYLFGVFHVKFMLNLLQIRNFCQRL